MEPTWMIRFCVGGVNVAIRFFFFFFFGGLVWVVVFFLFGVCVCGRRGLKRCFPPCFQWNIFGDPMRFGKPNVKSLVGF